MKESSSGGVTIGNLMPDEPTFVRLLDTVWADRGGLHDDLATPEQATEWFTRAGFEQVSDFTDDQARQVRRLRDSLRRLAAHHTADTRTRASSPVSLAQAVDVVNSYAGLPSAGPQIHLTSAGKLRISPSRAQTLEDVLVGLSRKSIDALTRKEELPLRACMAPACVLYYLQDHPRRAWCSPLCGNRARAARHYARHRTTQ